jgi:hypothetical protein
MKTDLTLMIYITVSIAIPQLRRLIAIASYPTNQCTRKFNFQLYMQLGIAHS